jgi:hypothetical protein
MKLSGENYERSLSRAISADISWENITSSEGWEKVHPDEPADKYVHSAA